MAIPAQVGSVATLALVLEGGEGSFYPQAEIYAPGAAAPLATIDLVHRAKGRYEGEWIPASPGSYTAQFFIYVDAAHTVESIIYMREAEQVFVTSASVDDLALQLARVLGLVHENVFIDNTDYDDDNQLIAARVRIFDSKTNALAATYGGSETTGLIATYSISSEYGALAKMRQYRMVRD